MTDPTEGPGVSVVIPTFDRCAWLRDCLASVGSQTVPPLEIIVVDDGSTDGTDRMMAVEFPSVRYLSLPHTGLPAVARNAGIDAARGAFIAFCDSDDTWDPDKLRVQIAAARSTGAGLICTDASVMNEPSRGYLERYRWRWRSARRQLLWDNFVITSSVIVRRSVLGQLRFPADPRFRGVEDYALWLRLAAETEIRFLPDRLVRYRLHEGNMSTALRTVDPRNQRIALLASGLWKREPGLAALKTVRTWWQEMR